MSETQSNGKMTFLGTGGAFSRPDVNYHNNVLLEFDDECYLIDCGTAALNALDDIGYSPLDIDGVIITHLHADHIGGLEEFAFQHYFLGDNKPSLYIHPTLLPEHPDAVMYDGYEPGLSLWENCLKGGMMHLQDEEGNAVEGTIDTYFDVHPVDIFSLFGHEFHFMTTNHVPNKKTYGLRIHTPDRRTILYTADARPLDDDFLYEDSDLIFHDCSPHPFYEATVHSHLEELVELPEGVREKTYLMHYGKTPIMQDRDLKGMRLAKRFSVFNL